MYFVTYTDTVTGRTFTQRCDSEREAAILASIAETREGLELVETNADRSAYRH